MPIIFWILLAVGLVCSFIFYFTTQSQKPPKFILLFALCGFLIAIFWVNWISNVLIDVLGLVGLMFNIPTSYLGLTILALIAIIVLTTINKFELKKWQGYI